MTRSIVTPLYMAPEMYDSGDSTAVVDVYSFSLIVSEIFVGEPAFPTTRAPIILTKKVINGFRPRLPLSTGVTVANIVRQEVAGVPDRPGILRGHF
jgi:serine/threonine protein kinase